MKKEETETLAALLLMRDRFRDAEEAETINRISAEDAVKFYFGEKQWNDEIERARKADGRPCFTLNKLPAILKQVLNETRQNKPKIQISPVSDGASEETAEVLQDLTKHVEDRGEGSEVAYMTAYEYMTIGGFGSWRVLHEYLHKSFNQDLLIGRIANPFSVYWDPAAQMLDKSDARYCFITKDLSGDAFKLAYPKSELSGMNDFAGVGDQAPGWVTKDGCRVVEYFEVKSEDVELLQLEDGSTCYEDELPKGARIAKGDDGAPITRPDTRKVAWVAVSNGVEWLEAPKKLPTDDIPVISIYGDELLVDSENRIKGMVQDLEEPQKLFNYNSSAISETMALGSKANWIATAEQIEPYMAIWKQANTRNMAVLPYKSVAGQPPPSKISTEPPIQAMSAARLQSSDDLRSISGVYDASQSPNGGEESGKAILARRHQATTGNAHYSGNLGRGIRRTAQILLKYFPVIYDTARVMRITGADQQAKQVIVHSGQPDTAAALMSESIKGVFDLSAGEYSVSVQVMPDPGTKRQETVEMLLTLCAANPAIVPIVGDLVVQEMDFSGKKAFVERLQRALPPNLQDNANNPTDPGQLQAHNGQLMAQNQQLMQKVQQITQMLQTKQVEAQGRLQVESLKLQGTQTAAQAKVEEARIQAQVSILKEAAGKNFDAVHGHALADKQNAHETAMAQLGQVHSMMSATHAAALQPEPEAPAKAA